MAITAAGHREPASSALIAAIFALTTRLIWPGADADRAAVARVDDRVRLDELRDVPGEQQVVQLAPASARACVTTFRSSRSSVSRCRRPAPAGRRADALEVERRATAVAIADAAARARWPSSSNAASAPASIVRRDQHLDELAVEDRLRGRRVERAVERDDAAERGGRIGGIGAARRLRRASRRARRRTGLACLTITQAGASELAHAFPARHRRRRCC